LGITGTLGTRQRGTVGILRVDDSNLPIAVGEWTFIQRCITQIRTSIQQYLLRHDVAQYSRDKDVLKITVSCSVTDDGNSQAVKTLSIEVFDASGTALTGISTSSIVGTLPGADLAVEVLGSKTMDTPIAA